ncbi:MAG TPA: tRNA 4-thiouridine(8) synthase ThiI [Clostridiales bacterium]|nr:tRNA 4-thiouridine(8) synthase ThiI [Clostridiales bacterium]
MNTILIRYGEIFLKGNNRGYFESALAKNIRTALENFNFKFVRAQNRFLIEDYDEAYETDIIDKLTKIFGIHSVSVAVKVKSTEEELEKAAVLMMKDKSGTFRVTVNRADKKIQKSSMELAAQLGGAVLESNPNLTVNLHVFDTDLYVDIRENGLSYLFTDKIMGAGGMPVGTAGAGMVLLSGGIDSPVAAYMMAKRGLKLHAIHFHSAPYTSEMAKQKVVDLAGIVKNYSSPIVLHVIPFTDVQLKIHEKCPAELMITIMRRFMMRIAERVAKANSCGALITGESLGQVASQTMESITVTNGVIEDLPVFRPLIGMDKTEIMDIAHNIDTYDTSILPYEDCCTIFLPKNPVIRPKLETVLKAEAKLDVETLIAACIENQEIINV